MYNWNHTKIKNQQSESWSIERQDETGERFFIFFTRVINLRASFEMHLYPGAPMRSKDPNNIGFLRLQSLIGSHSTEL